MIPKERMDRQRQFQRKKKVVFRARSAYAAKGLCTGYMTE